MNQYQTSKILKFFVWTSSIITLFLVTFIIGYILIGGIKPLINEIAKLFVGKPSIFNIEYTSQNVSMIPALINTLILTLLSVMIAGIFGILTAIYLVEYSKQEGLLVKLIRLTTETLAGIPSIIYGLFGSIFFVAFLNLGMSLLSGIFTISIMILPLIIRSTEEALKSVPMEFREASFGLGAGKFRTIFKIVLPSATNGILAGIILAIGRVVGETACLLYTSGTSPNVGNILETGRTLSVHMYMLTSEGLFVEQAYATSAVLLMIVVGMNMLSVFIAKKIIK